MNSEPIIKNKVTLTPKNAKVDISGDNEKAFHFWKSRIIASPPVVAPHLLSVVFNYTVMLKRSFWDKIFLRHPTAQKQFTTSNVFELTFIEKGNCINNFPMESSVLWIHITTEDERRFYGSDAVFAKKNLFGVPCTITPEGVLRTHIEIAFSDIVSMTFTEG